MEQESRPGNLADLVLMQTEAISFLVAITGKALADLGALTLNEYANLLISSKNDVLVECGNSLIDSQAANR
jgi:hypothetical protein